ncbi:trypsin-like serine peptidase [Azospirillum picis]|uniref:Protease YdgD n=1 Tax=Azospirillum picis TaxID=488438 RepID=A0ABU0ME48_9PROT|nr:trypsin-like serine protease [Azospirillum picis]MBP2297841.1 protease YdgD [Azospirillum picis]MDQ0531679.1 protease YdgD [Azospirillum picis]
MRETEQERAATDSAFRIAVLRAVAGLALALAVPASVVAPNAARAEQPLLPGVGQADRRAPVDAAEAPWRSVVRVQTNLAGRCTGALVGPRTVLTAGHCLFNPRTRRFLQASSLHVLFGYDRGAYSRHATVVRVETDPSYDPAAARPDEAGDWAILTLSEPAPASVPPLPVQAAPLPAGTPVMLGGYSQDRSQILMADRDCRVLGGGRGLLVHDCSATRGTSGGPLLVRADGGKGQGWAVAGVGVAAGNTPEVRNIAVPAANFAALLARNTAAGQP